MDKRDLASSVRQGIDVYIQGKFEDTKSYEVTHLFLPSL